MYTNNCVGGDLGTNGNSVIFNGVEVSHDEAMVIFTLPMLMNQDTRVKETKPDSSSLIDINLPRSPVITQIAWQDRGFHY